MESMVVGKSSILALIISVSLLTSCANTQETYITSGSVTSSTNSKYLETSTSVATVVNLFRWGLHKQKNFIPDKKLITYGQMPKKKKLKMDHRYIAFQKLKKKIKIL